MKKKLTTLMLALGFSICAIAQNTAYLIDQAATGKAPWKTQEIVSQDELTAEIAKDKHKTFVIEKKFIGVTTDGKYIVQEFYANGKPFTDEYLVASEADVSKGLNRGEITSIADGTVKVWQPDGKLAAVVVFEKGNVVQACQWNYDNQLMSENENVCKDYQ